MLQLVPDPRPEPRAWLPATSAPSGEPIAVRWADLGPDDAARIVRLYGEVTILVNTAAPDGLLLVVAGHAWRQHAVACTRATCGRLWVWFGQDVATA